MKKTTNNIVNSIVRILCIIGVGACIVALRNGIDWRTAGKIVISVSIIATCVIVWRDMNDNEDKK